MKILYCFLILILYLSACQSSDNLILVRNGKSGYQIVIPEKPDSLELKAAKELQHYFELIGDLQLPVIQEGSEKLNKGIYVGKTTLTKNIKLIDNQLYIGINNNNLLIVGSDQRSTLYGVYTFLEEYMNCRFYAPEVEKIPTEDRIIISRNLSYSYLPDITTRTVHSRLFYENPDFADKRKVTHEAFPTYVPTARVHTFHLFMPEDVFFKSHPEYYALRNKQRLPTQLCLTNPDVFSIVKDSVSVLLKRYPDADVISVSQDDNQQYCQCESCEEINQREESPSGSMIDFVNRIAREFPDKMISTLAYQYTRKAPKFIKPEGNVLITLCSIECDRSAPIRNNCRDFADDLIAWGALSDNIRIWDYTTQFTNFLAPFPNIHTLKSNIQLFRENNARWIFEQHSHQPSELFELRSYLTANLLWNPDINSDSVLQDFLTGYYFDAGPHIGNYIKTVHEALHEDHEFFLFLYGDPSQAFSSFLKPALLSKYESWYELAEKAVSDQPDILNRVKVAGLSVDYAILEASRKNLSEQYSLTIINNGQKIIPDRLRKRIVDFRETCEKNDITYMNEMRFTVSEYLDFYEKTLNRAQLNNLATGKSVLLGQPATKYADEDPQVLTDGAYGGSSFFANWLGFDGNDLEATIDLDELQMISEVSSAFLQVTNHIVFFPERVRYLYSVDGENFILLGMIPNARPLTKTSKTNDIQYFSLSFNPVNARYIKIIADNMKKAPVWHHGAGLSTWIFVDEIEIR